MRIFNLSIDEKTYPACCGIRALAQLQKKYGSLKEFENNERTLIIATHLIEEVSNIIEEVVLIDKGKILVQETVEELLEKGYSVSGAAQEVDRYCAGRNVIGYDELGGLKVAYILGEKTVLPQESNLQITAMNLQKLFVKMTEKGGGENE